jgi:hypothetical protein
MNWVCTRLYVTLEIHPSPRNLQNNAILSKLFPDIRTPAAINIEVTKMFCPLCWPSTLDDVQYPIWPSEHSHSTLKTPPSILVVKTLLFLEHDKCWQLLLKILTMNANFISCSSLVFLS